MATIVFVMLPEMGHLNASFKVAKSLRQTGHQVYYSEPKYLEGLVIGEGFEFIPLLENFFPADFVPGDESAQSWFEVLKSGLELETEAGTQYALAVLKAELAGVLEKSRPDLLLIDGLLPEFAVTAYAGNIPCALINTALYDPFNDHGLIENAPVFAPILLKMPTLFLCPQAFDFPRQNKKENHYYVEASVDLDRKEVPFPWPLLGDDQPLIYCSLGTQSSLYSEGKEILQRLIEAIGRTNYQMVLSIGNHLRLDEFRDTPPNVILVNSAPQLKMLRKASMMITHGGLNTIKECILLGVPMIVFPMGRDQPRNASRVAYHGLGVMGDIQRLSVEQVTSLISKVECNPMIRANVEAMRDVFLEMESSGRSVGVIELILAKFQR
jgi:UDP:flavonoid glycosyltransferase YjiC (YdhE family)